MDLSLAVLSGIGTIQGLLFAILILLKKRKQQYDWILFVWFLVFSLHLSLMFASQFNTVELSEILIMTLGFLHAPFFWIYAKTLLGKGNYPLDYVHFLPFWFFFVGSFLVEDVHNVTWELVILLPKILVLTLYPILVLRLITKEKSNKKPTSHRLMAPHFLWIKTAAYIFMISIGISLIRLSTELMVGVSYFEFWDVLRYTLLLMVMGFFGLKYGMVYKAEDLQPQSKKIKYKDSPLGKGEIETIHQTIEHFFQENEAYLNPKFSLLELSKATKIKKHHLSQVINLKMNSGFYDLINSKRIDHAIGLIKQRDRRELTLEGLGYECGFNSKSVFFQNFKKYTGKTPGSFRQEIGSD